MDSSSTSNTLSPEEENTRWWSQFYETGIYEADLYTNITMTCEEDENGERKDVTFFQSADSDRGAVLPVTHNPLTRTLHGLSAFVYPTGSSPSEHMSNPSTGAVTMIDMDPAGRLVTAGVLMNLKPIEDPSEYVSVGSQHNKAYTCDAVMTQNPLKKVYSDPGITLLLSQHFHDLARRPRPESDTNATAAAWPNSQG
jgi:hypothetical protein